MVVYALFENYNFACEETNSLINLFQSLSSAEAAQKDREEKLVECHRKETTYYVETMSVL